MEDRSAFKATLPNLDGDRWEIMEFERLLWRSRNQKMCVSKYGAKRSVWHGERAYVWMLLLDFLSTLVRKHRQHRRERDSYQETATQGRAPRHSGEQSEKLTTPGASRATLRVWQSAFPGEFAWLAMDRASIVALSGFAVTGFPPLLTHRHLYWAATQQVPWTVDDPSSTPGLRSQGLRVPGKYSPFPVFICYNTGKHTFQWFNLQSNFPGIKANQLL